MNTWAKKRDRGRPPRKAPKTEVQRRQEPEPSGARGVKIGSEEKSGHRAAIRSQALPHGLPARGLFGSAADAPKSST